MPGVAELAFARSTRQRTCGLGTSAVADFQWGKLRLKRLYRSDDRYGWPLHQEEIWLRRSLFVGIELAATISSGSYH